MEEKQMQKTTGGRFCIKAIKIYSHFNGQLFFAFVLWFEFVWECHMPQERCAIKMDERIYLSSLLSSPSSHRLSGHLPSRVFKCFMVKNFNVTPCLHQFTANLLQHSLTVRKAGRHIYIIPIVQEDPLWGKAKQNTLYDIIWNFRNRVRSLSQCRLCSEFSLHNYSNK